MFEITVTAIVGSLTLNTNPFAEGTLAELARKHSLLLARSIFISFARWAKVWTAANTWFETKGLLFGSLFYLLMEKRAEYPVTDIFLVFALSN